MEKLLQSKICNLVVWMLVVGGAGCTADLSAPSTGVDDTHQVERWSVRLPGNAGIYNEGLIGLPVVNERVLFHSTMFTNETQEDNRLHALDVVTGKLVWTFPAGFNPSEPYYFEGRPHLTGNLLVTKMSAFEPYSYHDRILILDVNSGTQQKLIHMPNALSRFSCRDVTGVDTEAWFIQEDHRQSYVYKLSLPSGDTTCIATLRSGISKGRLEVTTRELHLYNYEGQRILAVGTLDNQENKSLVELLIINADTGKEILRKEVHQDLNFIINSVVIRDRQLYYTCGRLAGCIDISNRHQRWLYDAGGSVDRIIPGLFVQDSVALLWGHAGYSAVEIGTGKQLYKREIACSSVNGNSPYFIVLRSDGKVSVIHQQTGRELHELTVSSRTDSSGFSYSCKPGISNGNLFLFGEYNAYCFDLAKIVGQPTD